MLAEKAESASSESHSVQERWSYVRGVSEIVITHPIGAGYSGFRDAMMSTEAYASGMAADETMIDAEQSNPHSLFLYYASAGGLVGGALCIAIFILLCRAILKGIGIYGLSGALLAFCSVVAYFVLAVSVAYLFNSSVMLIPAALSAGIRAHVLKRVNSL
jgi:O-antigen ligase